MLTFACFSCKSPAFTLEGDLTDETQARCVGCGAPLGNWGMLRQQLETRLTNLESRAKSAGRHPVLKLRPVAVSR